MAENDPFARLEAGLAQPMPEKVGPLKDEEIIQQEEKHFADLFDGIRKFDTVLQRNGDWNTRFSWLNVDSDRIAHGQIDIFRNGHVAKTVPLFFQGKGVWFTDPEFKKVTRQEKEHGGWIADELDEIKSALSTYIQHVVQDHG
ncbi:hypothetical protein MKK75_01515 [Methylobacterium sp. J-030]|uniref:hypothetical protein n=1 Tax=Methylobacterium sp. J-030 TaxID=2836627 RepID=UPI001FBA77A2|nr:hypothetical protein [Methylobacterium sp. J-030]MCJ2067494.1 hypothetical protein [Methylobacterium sp. J-030]